MSARRSPFRHPVQPSAKVLVVGGNWRKSGKTSLAVEILHSFPGIPWVAVKISAHAHGDFSLYKSGCNCDTDTQTFAIREERESNQDVDTARFLTAGAARALWLQVKPGHLGEAWPVLCSQLEGVSHVILESNAAASLLRACLHLVTLDLRRPEFKPSLQNTLGLVDAFVLRAFLSGEMPQTVLSKLGPRPIFVCPAGKGLPAGLREFIRKRFIVTHPIRKRYPFRLFS